MFRGLLFQKKKNISKPISAVQIELTNHCNYRCRFCPQSQWKSTSPSSALYNRPKGYMDYALFCRVADQASQVTSELNFSFFGEPMMHPEFLKCMDYLKQAHPQLRVVMNTNMSYATKQIFDKLIDIELSELRISIDAATQTTYDSVRRGNFYLSLDGEREQGKRFETIQQKMEYWFSLPGHRPTRHVFTVSEWNVSDLEAYVRQWLPLLGDADTILCKNVLTYGGKISDKMISENKCNVWELGMLTVDWTGRVSPCNLDTNMDLAVGSILEKDLLELHQSREWLQTERLSKAKEIIPCTTCVDGNNWSRNVLLKKGDRYSEDCLRAFMFTKSKDKI